MRSSNLYIKEVVRSSVLKKVVCLNIGSSNADEFSIYEDLFITVRNTQISLHELEDVLCSNISNEPYVCLYQWQTKNKLNSVVESFRLQAAIVDIAPFQTIVGGCIFVFTTLSNGFLALIKIRRRKTTTGTAFYRRKFEFETLSMTDVGSLAGPRSRLGYKLAVDTL